MPQPRRASAAVAALLSAALCAAGVAAAPPAAATTAARAASLPRLTQAVPAAPADVAATAGPGAAATVTWSPADGNGSLVTGYTVTASPGGATAEAAADATSAVVPGLTYGTAYTFTVTATSADGTGPASLPSNEVTPVAAPSQVTGVTATVSRTSATVSWDAAAPNGSAITGYAVTASSGGHTASAPGDATSATVDGLLAGTTYSFTVTATNAVGTSEPSEPSGPVRACDPAAPTEVRASVGGDRTLLVEWERSDSPGVWEYVVTASPGGATARADSGSGTYVHGLEAGTAYSFTVASVDDHGCAGAPSAPSEPVTAVARPLTPTGVSATTDGETTTVAWDPPAPGAPPVAAYRVTAADGVSGVTVAGDATSADVTAFRVTSSSFTVTATNVAGDSDPSGSVTPVGPPERVTGVSASLSGIEGRVGVSWPAPHANGSAVTGYTVTASPGGAAVSVEAPQQWAAFDLLSGVPYTFTVTATNAYGTSTPGAPSDPVTPEAVPWAPTGVTATLDGTTATVTWTRPANLAQAKMYRLDTWPGGTYTLVDGAVTTATVAGLVRGRTYTFTVEAFSAKGAGPRSAPSDAVTPSDTTAPVVTPRPLPRFTPEHMLAFTATAADDGEVASYDVRYRVARYDGTLGAYRYPAAHQRTKTGSAVAAAEPGWTYCFSARARDLAGNVSAWTRDTCTAAPLDDRRFTRSASWAGVDKSGYLHSRYLTTATTGATLTRTGVVARRLGIVGTRCPGCGRVAVYLNGVLVGRVSFDGPVKALKQVGVLDLGRVRSGTLKIVAAGRVEIDGLGLGRP